LPSPSADQYALAQVAYEWLFGRRLLSSDLEIPALPGIDTQRLARTFGRATATDPSQRFDTCSDFVRSIGRCSPVALEAGVPEIENSRGRHFQPEPRVLPFVAPVDELPLYPSERQHAGDADFLSQALPDHSEDRPQSGHRRLFAATLIFSAAIGATMVWIYTREPAAPAATTHDLAQEYTEAAVTQSDGRRDSNPASPIGSGATRALTEPIVAPPRDDVTRVTAPQPAPVNSARMAQHEAGLLVHSTPPGALVRIDGVPRGSTPVAVRGLDFGLRSVLVSRPGFRTLERQVLLTEQRPSRTLEIDLLPLARSVGTAEAASPTDGSLVVDSRPAGASVFVDGREVGVTPLVIRVPAGQRGVRLERDGYRAVSTLVDVAAGGRTRVAARLEGGQDEK
jgi:hypothetical protein